jgi:hypothetical protein
VGLRQVEATGPHVENGGVLAQLVVLALLVVLDAAVDRVREVELPLDHVAPRRRVRVLEIRHEAARTRVQGVDHHLAAGRSGDLDAPILERVGHRRDPEVLRRGHEVERFAGVEPLLELLAGVEQMAAAIVEFFVEPADERQPLVCEGLLVRRLNVHQVLVSFL